MTRIILADNQAIFRAGVARLLALEEDLRIVDQCDNSARLEAAVESNAGSILLFSASLQVDGADAIRRARAAACPPILIAENDSKPVEELVKMLDGFVYRSIPGADLLECIRRVEGGQRYIQPSHLRSTDSQDSVGARVRDRLTPKELQIVALIVQGCKNKEIAQLLKTKEQVIKNYLRSIYDKSGVSDRLELALFAIHHKVLADAAAAAYDRTLLQDARTKRSMI